VSRGAGKNGPRAARGAVRSAGARGVRQPLPARLSRTGSQCDRATPQFRSFSPWHGQRASCRRRVIALEERAPSLDTLDGHCLAEEVIHALACGALEPAERSKALAHLDECELCQALLDDEVRGLPEFSSSDGVGAGTLIQVGAL